MCPVPCVCVLLLFTCQFADDTRPAAISPAEAAKKVGRKVTVEMEVKSVGRGKSGVYFLNSESNFRTEGNFTLFIGNEAASMFKKAGMADPAEYFEDKKIRATGRVRLYRNQPEIVVEDPKQIELVDEKADREARARIEARETNSVRRPDEMRQPGRDPAPFAMRVMAGMAAVAEPVLYYEMCGEGELVVFLHGGQLDCRMWDDQFQNFARHYRVIRYDVRGYGKSEAPARPYADEEDLLELFRFLHIDRAHLVGLSLGGRIAIDFALQHPDRVKSLAVAGPGLSGFEWSAGQGSQIVRAARDRGAEAAVDLWLKDPYMAPAMENPVLAKRLRQLALDNARCWLVNPLLGRELTPPAARRLGEIRAPMLALVGSRDVPDIQAIVKLIEKTVPHARKVVIGGAGHMVNMEKPEEFNRELLEFLRKAEGRPF